MIIGSFDTCEDGFTGKILAGAIAYDDVEICAKRESDLNFVTDYKVMAHTIIGFVPVGVGWRNDNGTIDIRLDNPTFPKPVWATLHTRGYFEGRLIWDRPLPVWEKIEFTVRNWFERPG